MRNLTDDQIIDAVKSWIRENGTTQEELAKKIGLKGQTLRSQMSKSKLSSNTKLSLLKLIPSLSTQAIQATHEEANEQEIVLTFTDDEWSIIQDFKKFYPGKRIEDYCRDKALEFCIGMSSAVDCDEEAKKNAKRIESVGTDELPEDRRYIHCRTQDESETA